MTGGAEEGVEIKAFTDGKEVIEPLSQRIAGRFVTEAVVHPANWRGSAAEGDLIEDAAEAN